MSDPYDMLGVARDCNRAAVRKAYIKKAKKMHPDAGGSNEQFGKLVLAYQVLSDEDRRARFDSTGTIDENAIGTEQAAILNLYAGFLDQIINSGPQAFLQDCVKVMRDGLKADINRVEQQLAQITNGIDHVTKLKARFKVKAGRNVLVDMLAEKERQLMAGRGQCENHISIRKKAIEQLKDCTFDADTPPPAAVGLNSFFQIYAQQTQAAGGKR